MESDSMGGGFKRGDFGELFEGNGIVTIIIIIVVILLLFNNN